ncbi:hypothetical protein ACWDSJ_13950 [Nocardia sp. NPDC003482]
MLEIGSRVRIRPHGVSVFEVVELGEDDERVLIQSVDDAPGRYPFSMCVRDLLPAD